MSLSNDSPIASSPCTESQARLARVRCALEARGFDALYVRNVVDIAYLTNFSRVFDSENAHALLVTKSQVFLHTDSRYENACRQAACGTDVQVSAQSMSHAAWALELFEKLSAEKGAQTGCLHVAIEDAWSVREHNAAFATWQPLLDAGTLAVHEIGPFMVDVRACKSDAEIEGLKAAQRVTDAGWAYMQSYVCAGMTEQEVACELNHFMLTHGASDVAFATIVAAGAHAASPHAIPDGTVIRAGEPVLFDFGAKVGAYCSDMTRVLCIGQPSEEVAQAYQAVRAANEAVEAALCEGVVGADMHAKAESVLASAGFAGKMGHSLGHGVGQEVHEQPCLSPRNKEALAAGSVVTVEPGVYLPGKFGLRLEDFGVVTRSGFEVFTQSSHEMAII